MDAALDIAIVTLVFAIFYAVAREEWMRYLAKYLILFGIMLTTFQLYVEYGGTVIETFFVVSNFVFFVLFALDLIMFVPMAVELVRSRWR